VGEARGPDRGDRPVSRFLVAALGAGLGAIATVAWSFVTPAREALSASSNAATDCAGSLRVIAEQVPGAVVAGCLLGLFAGRGRWPSRLLDVAAGVLAPAASFYATLAGAALAAAGWNPATAYLVLVAFPFSTVLVWPLLAVPWVGSAFALRWAARRARLRHAALAVLACLAALAAARTVQRPCLSEAFVGALRGGDHAAAIALAAAFPNLDAVDAEGESALGIAAGRGAAGTARILLVVAPSRVAYGEQPHSPDSGAHRRTESSPGGASLHCPPLGGLKPSPLGDRFSRSSPA